MMDVVSRVGFQIILRRSDGIAGVSTETRFHHTFWILLAAGSWVHGGSLYSCFCIHFEFPIIKNLYSYVSLSAKPLPMSTDEQCFHHSYEPRVMQL